MPSPQNSNTLIPTAGAVIETSQEKTVSVPLALFDAIVLNTAYLPENRNVAASHLEYFTDDLNEAKEEVKRRFPQKRFLHEERVCRKTSIGLANVITVKLKTR